MKYLYMVVEPFSSDWEDYLTVFPGQVVELLEEGHQYWLVCTIPSVKGELESEGFVPHRCLQHLTEGEYAMVVMIQCSCQCLLVYIFCTCMYCVCPLLRSTGSTAVLQA